MRYTATAVRAFPVARANDDRHECAAWRQPDVEHLAAAAGCVVAPVTLLFGPQVSLTMLLVLGFAGSATAMFYVLRRWGASNIAAVLGGALYGFSPALVNSGIGHYSLVLAMLPPLLLDRLLRIVTGRGRAVRNGIWLGVLTAVPAVHQRGSAGRRRDRRRDHPGGARRLPGLGRSDPGWHPPWLGIGTGAVTALVLCARALWVQFHGVPVRGATATVIIQYNGRMTNLGTLPYAFVVPASSVFLHSAGTAYTAAHYPQPTPEYLAYLGVPLIILLIVAVIRFWRDLTYPGRRAHLPAAGVAGARRQADDRGHVHAARDSCCRGSTCSTCRCSAAWCRTGCASSPTRPRRSSSRSRSTGRARRPCRSPPGGTGPWSPPASPSSRCSRWCPPRTR